MTTAVLGVIMCGCSQSSLPLPPERPHPLPKAYTPRPKSPNPQKQTRISEATPTPPAQLLASQITRSPLPESISPPQLLASKQTQSTLPPPLGASAADWRAYADISLNNQNYAQASLAFTKEAQIYRKIDPQAARVEELKAARYSSQLAVYQRVPPSPPHPPPLERLEPASGCYVGAFIDRDDRLASIPFGSQIFGDIPQFNSLTDKNHASFFTYLRYGNPFPAQWAAYVKRNDAICHLAWEPDSLDQINDDAYLQEFVSQLKAYDHPVILRFAGEMNGEWTPYHNDPARYKEKFRLVYRLTRQCPKVALLWCPNSVPADNIAQYYPGDDACDWVGVNLYSVLYIDNDKNNPGDWINPIDLLEPVYKAYAQRKPIAIGEYAASHRAACVPKDNVPFAQLKMSQLYGSLPLRYPRVKMVNWYDCNNLAKARAGRQLNNYQLTDDSHLLETYESQVNNGYFLGPQESAQWQAQPLKTGPIYDELKLEFFARCQIPNPIIYLKLDDKWRWSGQQPKPLACNLGRLKPGKHRLEIVLADRQSHLLQRQIFQLTAQ